MKNILSSRCSAFLVFLLLLALASCTANAQDREPPEPKPLGKVAFPDYQKHVLPNGLTVYVLEHHEQPVVAIELLLPVGADRDPDGLPGLAAVTAELLSSGTKTRSANEISESIDFVGGRLETAADMESTTVSAMVLTDSANLAFDLIHDLVMNPAFKEDELERVQQQFLSSLTANMQDPTYIADAVFQRVIYGSHPYGHPENGTVQSIPKITPADLVRFHDTYYAPNGSALAVAGDLSAAEIFKLAGQWFGSWQKKDVPSVKSEDVPNLQGRKIVVIDKPDSVQTEIRVGRTTVARKDPAYFGTLVGSYILGGSASSRLNRSLRVERGLTYGAFATIRPRKGPSGFYSTTSTRTEKTTEALKLVLDGIEKLGASEVSADELQNAKSFIIGSFPLTIEVPSNLATRLTTVFLYDLGDDYLKTFRDRLAAVSAAQVLRAASESISTPGEAVVLVGKAAVFQQQLTELGKVEVIPISDLDLDSAVLRRE